MLAPRFANSRAKAKSARAARYENSFVLQIEIPDPSNPFCRQQAGGYSCGDGYGSRWHLYLCPSAISIPKALLLL
jgi:hypothetical protein